jgi:hypothetical protein
MADQLSRLGSERLFIGPQPAWGISKGVARKAVRDWTITDHRKHWDSLSGLKQANALLQGPSAKKISELLNLSRDLLGWVVGLLTGHCHLKGHLLKLGVLNNPSCEWCLEKEESATNKILVCYFEAIAYLRFRHKGHYFMDPSDYRDVPIRRVLRLIRTVGLTKW